MPPSRSSRAIIGGVRKGKQRALAIQHSEGDRNDRVFLIIACFMCVINMRRAAGPGVESSRAPSSSARDGTPLRAVRAQSNPYAISAERRPLL
jgi:hypothetical protein